METTTTTTTETKPAKAKKITASSVFQRMIMENVDRTDLEIFREVQKQFGADKIPDRHANYVGWYRAFLKKNGKNPPAAVKAVKTAETKPENVQDRPAPTSPGATVTQITKAKKVSKK